MTSNEEVVDRLRDDILDGVFSPGERLVEVDLCETFSCGRAAIRAALAQLESESLVDRQPNRGAVVHRISVAEAIEITEARGALERLIAGRAARNVTDDDARALIGIVDEMRQAVDADDATRFGSLNRSLHLRLLDMSDHRTAGEMVANLRNRGVQHQFRLAMMPGRQEVSVGQHARIVDAVVAGDEEGAMEAMTEHLESVIEVLSRWVTAE